MSHLRGGEGQSRPGEERTRAARQNFRGVTREGMMVLLRFCAAHPHSPGRLSALPVLRGHAQALAARPAAPAERPWTAYAFASEADDPMALGDEAVPVWE